MHKVEADFRGKVIPRGMFRPGIEVFGAFALIEAALWLHTHFLEWSLAAFAWIALATILAGRSPRELGVTTKGFRESLWVASAGTGVAVLILFGGVMAGTLHIDSGAPRFMQRSLLYAVWALGQQFILLSFFFVRFERLFGSESKTVAATALLFTAAHLPNPVLLIAAVIGGVVAPLLFSRYRNIYTLAIAHALLGLALAAAIPESLHHQMKVGSGYDQRVVNPHIREGRE